MLSSLLPSTRLAAELDVAATAIDAIISTQVGAIRDADCRHQARRGRRCFRYRAICKMSLPCASPVWWPRRRRRVDVFSLLPIGGEVLPSPFGLMAAPAMREPYPRPCDYVMEKIGPPE